MADRYTHYRQPQEYPPNYQSFAQQSPPLPPPASPLVVDPLADVTQLQQRMYGPVGNAQSILERNSLQTTDINNNIVGARDDFVHVLKLESVEQFLQEKRDDLSSGFAQVAKMTLLEDASFLDVMYANESALADPHILADFIAREYKSQYADLVQMYPSVLPWMRFILYSLCHESEGYLKTAISVASNSASAYVTSVVESGPWLELRGGATVDKRPAKKARVSSRHRFLDSQFYKTNAMLFSIGQLCDRLVPSEFALLNVRIESEQCTRYRGSTTTQFRGVGATLMRPALVQIESHKRGVYDFLIATFTDGLSDLMAHALGAKNGHYLMSIGNTVADGTIQSLPRDGVKRTIASLAKNEEGELIVGILKKANAMKNTGSMASCRTYIPVKYAISNRPSQKNFQALVLANEADIEARRRQLADDAEAEDAANDNASSMI